LQDVHAAALEVLLCLVSQRLGHVNAMQVNPLEEGKNSPVASR